MATITIERSNTFLNAVDDVSKGRVQIAVVEAKGNCHVVVSKEMESIVGAISEFIKEEATSGLPTFYIVGPAASVIEKLSKGLLDPEVLPAIGEDKTYLQGQIVARRRSSDYIAFMSGDRTAWEAGRSIAEAIGKLVQYHMG